MTRILGGMKIYSFDWFLRYRLEYAEAADLLAAQGMDLVIAQSRYLPMADTAVKSEVTDEERRRFEAYDDRRFVAALHARGLQYLAACNLFFDPFTLARHPDARAVDASGRIAGPVDWYLAICPTHEGYFEDKLRQLEEAVRELRPDGVFLGFTRFPGFWEQWLPKTTRADWREYCFCPRCVRLFSASRGLDIPYGTTPAAGTVPPADAAPAAGTASAAGIASTAGIASAAGIASTAGIASAGDAAPGSWIYAHAYAEFAAWKAEVIHGRVRRIREALRRIHPSLQVMLNTVPFGMTDFNGAGREVFAQDWTRLRDVVDLFEVMAYHQILGRDVSWVGRITREVKTAVRRPVLVTVQAKPLYLEGMHAGQGRSPSLSVEEFAEALEAARDGGADGVIVFTWSDFLQQAVDHDARYVDAIRRITRE